jgi:exopolyphosphatase / guanosine-5'-triphosphate,3'-diphosphate pyrophosphatase
MKQYEQVVGIDLGSNTLRVAVLSCPRGELVASYEKVVGTADGLMATGLISEAAIKRVIDAIKQAQAALDWRGPLRAVATEALRRAVNREQVLDAIACKTGVVFEVIDGEEEAKLTLLAVRHRMQRLGLETDTFVLVDIGGGSTELIFWYEGEVITRSFPVGILTIAQHYQTLERIEAVLPEEMAQMAAYYSLVVAEHGRPQRCIATAGTPTTIAAMQLGMEYDDYDAQRINGMRLRREVLNPSLDKLLAMPLAQRERAVGVGRSDLIAAGILIFRELFDLAGFGECTIIDDGLREGVALWLCQ